MRFGDRFFFALGVEWGGGFGGPGELQPFLGANGYTFPVILAREYVENVVGPFSIPQNWIVDGAGTLREKSVGFDSKIADWPGRMAEKTLEVAH